MKNWLVNLPFSDDIIDDFQMLFPVSWYKYLLAYFVRVHVKSQREAARGADVIKAAAGKNEKHSSGGVSSGRNKSAKTTQDKYGSEPAVGPRMDPVDEQTMRKVVADEAIEEAYRLVVACCVGTLVGNNSPTPDQVYDTFIAAPAPPSTPSTQWLHARAALHALTLRAYRIAVKVSLDHVLIGLNSSSWPDLLDALDEYHTRWFFGPDNTNKVSKRTSNEPVNLDRLTTARIRQVAQHGGAHVGGTGLFERTTNENGYLENLDKSIDMERVPTHNKVQPLIPIEQVEERAIGGSNDRLMHFMEDFEEEEDTAMMTIPKDWASAIREEVPNLFALGYNDVKGVHTSHLATLQRAGVGVGQLAGAVVRSVWAALAAEMIYFTNDDDERYSIQAHATLLRNLTIQAADPPLGYPVYSSPPVRLGLPWLNPTLRLMHSRDDAHRRRGATRAGGGRH